MNLRGHALAMQPHGTGSRDRPHPTIGSDDGSPLSRVGRGTVESLRDVHLHGLSSGSADAC
jgi:hypothetical protein